MSIGRFRWTQSEALKMTDKYVYLELEGVLLKERRGVWDKTGVVEES